MEYQPNDVPPANNTLADFLNEVDQRHKERMIAGKSLRILAWRGLAGGDLDRMLESAERAAEYLSHSNPRLREVAMSVLTHHFAVCEQMQVRFESLSDNDPDSQVRLAARLALIACYRKKNDPRAKRSLAEIVRDESQSDEVRLSCYVLLMSLVDAPLERWPARFPDDVDWTSVDETRRAP